MKYQKEFAQLMAKAWADPDFKTKCLKSPKEALLEMGISLPDNVNIYIHENTKKERHLTIPMKPEEELSETELRKAAGGVFLSDLSSGS